MIEVVPSHGKTGKVKIMEVSCRKEVESCCHLESGTCRLCSWWPQSFSELCPAWWKFQQSGVVKTHLPMLPEEAERKFVFCLPLPNLAGVQSHCWTLRYFPFNLLNRIHSESKEVSAQMWLWPLPQITI